MEDGTSLEPTSKVAEAQGMVSAQAECTTEAALQLLNERAKATGLRLEEVAVAVVNRRTQFRHATKHVPI
jgi:AmiR/NasT family two-component response regulator